MKNLLLSLSFLVIAGGVFAQTKPADSTAKPKPDSSKVPPVLGIAPKPKLYMILLNEQEVINLYSIIRTSGSMKGVDIEQYISQFDGRLKDVKQ